MTKKAEPIEGLDWKKGTRIGMYPSDEVIRTYNHLRALKEPPEGVEVSTDLVGRFGNRAWYITIKITGMRNPLMSRPYGRGGSFSKRRKVCDMFNMAGTGAQMVKWYYETLAEAEETFAKWTEAYAEKRKRDEERSMRRSMNSELLEARFPDGCSDSAFEAGIDAVDDGFEVKMPWRMKTPTFESIDTAILYRDRLNKVADIVRRHAK